MYSGALYLGSAADFFVCAIGPSAWRRGWPAYFHYVRFWRKADVAGIMRLVGAESALKI